jgi:hypothetical protein
MRFYTKTHQHYCGIDLHAKTMYLCILDSEGAVALHRNIPCEPEKFLRAIAPYREDLVVAVECVLGRRLSLIKSANCPCSRGAGCCPHGYIPKGNTNDVRCPEKKSCRTN